MKRVLSRLWAGWTGRIMLTFLGVVLLVGLFAPVLPLGDPVAMDPMQKLLGPSALHPFGTDHLGRDTLSRIIWGIRTTVYTSILAMIATSVIGALYGGIAGTAGGKTDSALMRFADFFMSFPSEVLILAMVGILGPGLGNIVIACIASKWAWYARMMRAVIRKAKLSGYVTFAETAGESPAGVLFRHLFPVAAGEFFVLLTLDTGAVVLDISTLSFLGLGVQPPAPEWGMMLSEAKGVLFAYPGQMAAPGFAFLLVVAAFNFLGDALRDAFDTQASGRPEE